MTSQYKISITDAHRYAEYAWEREDITLVHDKKFPEELVIYVSGSDGTISLTLNQLELAQLIEQLTLFARRQMEVILDRL
jgi:hypothetical protein